MGQRKEIRLSGSGGQGLILAAIILAEAAARDGAHVVQTQAYGPEARGGSSKAEVITDSDEIHFPKVRQPDLVLAMNEKSYRQYGTDVKDDGILVVDSTFVKEVAPTGRRTVALPITKIAREKLGREIVANIVALGAINEIMKIVSCEALKKAVLSRAPKGTEAMNEQALELGRSLADGLES